jgi:hypothetical protein
MPSSTPFPTFKQPYLQSFRLCACFSLGDGALSDRIRERKGNGALLLEAAYETARGSARMRVKAGHRTEIEPSGDEEGYLQFQCSLDSALRRPLPIKRSSTKEDIKGLLTLFAQQKSLRMNCAEGIFYVPHDELPERGFIRLLFDLAMEVGDATVNMSGATLDIQRCDPYEQLQWKERPSQGTANGPKKEVELVIFASPTETMLLGSPEKLADLLSNGVQKLALQRSK